MSTTSTTTGKQRGGGAKARRRTPSPSTSGTPTTPIDETLMTTNKRKRVSRACDSCFAKKDRCDGALPVCKVCRDLDRACTYNRPERKRGPLQGVRQRLEAQVDVLESVLGFLVDTFPTLGHDALRSLALDDGEEFVRQTMEQGSNSSPPSGLGSVAGPSRIPAGEVYPRYTKVHAKHLWRKSNFAKAIAPSLGLRLSQHDEDEDLLDIAIHHQRVEEARRARANLMHLLQADVVPSHSRRVTMQAAPFPYSTTPSMPLSNAPSFHQTHAFTESEHVPLASVHSHHHHQHQHHQHLTHPPPPSHSTGHAKHTSHAHLPVAQTPDAGFSADAFIAPWSNEGFDLSDLGEGAHALAYALGLQNADGGEQHTIATTEAASTSPNGLPSVGSPRPFYDAGHTAGSPPLHLPIGRSGSVHSVMQGAPSRSSPLRSITHLSQQHFGSVGGGDHDARSEGMRMFNDGFEAGASFPPDQASTILYQLGLQDHAAGDDPTDPTTSMELATDGMMGGNASSTERRGLADERARQPWPLPPPTRMHVQ